MTPAISVVVPLHDEEAHLAECLESLARQTQALAPDLYSLTMAVSDSGGADPSPRAFILRASPKCGPTSCRPTGSSPANPQGIDMAGRPARFAPMV